MAEYNYDSFSSDDYDFDASKGPRIGDRAPDFELTTASGERRRLLDFDAELLVVELGSITCPLFQTRRPQMSALDAFDDRVQSVILYVREAHPGEDIPRHGTLEDKSACARRLTEEDGETRLILVDDIEGSAHQAYGGMPNAVYVVNRQGCVVFKADWNNPSATQAAVRSLLDGRPARAKSYFRPASPAVSIHTLRRAGRGSALDFFRSLPVLIWNNLVKRNLRTLFGRPPVAALDTTC
ncbi:MAG: hypothetical protein KTR31_29825 [Myxococcales bacterium]|nr:hypothetical protein [Myxococcales bacterium]